MCRVACPLDTACSAEAKLIESEQHRVDEGLQRSTATQRTTEHTVTTHSTSRAHASASEAAVAELETERRKGGEARAACRELERELQEAAAQVCGPSSLPAQRLLVDQQRSAQTGGVAVQRCGDAFHCHLVTCRPAHAHTDTLGCALQVKKERVRCGQLQKELTEAQQQVRGLRGQLQDATQGGAERTRELSSRVSLLEAQNARLQAAGSDAAGENGAAQHDVRDAVAGTDAGSAAPPRVRAQASGAGEQSRRAAEPQRKANGVGTAGRQEASENSGADNGANHQGTSYAAKEQVAAAERKLAGLRRKLTQRNEEAAALQRTHEAQTQRCAATSVAACLPWSEPDTHQAAEVCNRERSHVPSQCVAGSQGGPTREEASRGAAAAAAARRAAQGTEAGAESAAAAQG